MAYIRVIDESEAAGELREAYGDVTRSRGKVANILKIQSLIPRSLSAHLGFYDAVMFGRPGLPRRMRELIATVVSKANGCEYCTAHHAEALNAYVKDRAIVDAIVDNPHDTPLEPNERAAVAYALRLTREPETVTEEDVELLRAAGFTDEDVLSLALVVSYFNFVNRMALGLGARHDEDEVRGYNS